MTISIGETEVELNSEMDAALRKELLENAATILTTFRGTNPQNRAMGIVSREVIGRSLAAAEGAYSVQAVEQVEKYEPRLSVTHIGFYAEGQKIIPKVVLTYNGS